jgi:hypothetical protein
MNKKQKLAFRIMPLLPIAFLVAFTGCSGIQGTAGNQRVTINFLTKAEQDDEKYENPPIRPGQPYNQATWSMP